MQFFLKEGDWKVNNLFSIKMNNTNGSRLTTKTRYAEGFRVMLKQRTGHHQKLEEVNRVSASQLVKSQDISPVKLNRSLNYSDMKDYVRNKMKTQYGASFMPNKTAQSFRTITANSPSRQNTSRTEKQGNTEQKRCLSSLTKQKIELDNIKTIQEPKVKETSNQQLSTLQRKIETLLDQRLNICAARKKSRDEKVQNQLQKMIIQLRDLKKEDPETAEAHIAYFDHKVKLFERLMAESSIESEIMKKDYMAKIANRSRHSRIKTDGYQRQSRLSINRYAATPQRSSVINCSTTQRVFKAPEAGAYKIYKYKNLFFNADRHRQPLPRSSYNRQYLVCPQNVDKEMVPLDNKFMGNSNSAKFLQTNYQASFVAKHSDKIDSNELDARRNKIKDLAVVYSREKVDISPNSYIALMKRMRESVGMKTRIANQLSSYKPVLSESRRAYGVGGTHISSEIKHDHLQKLKYQYKMRLHT